MRKGLLIRDGLRRAISVIEYKDPIAELLRAAVCDVEVIQAIGRGRGVNRIDTNSLEVRVLADVALPLAYDRVITWDGCMPDIIQQMLLAGGAVDSPADAAVLNPSQFKNAEAAKKAFQRAAFRGQIPILNPFRELSLKSAAYLHGGRGQSWQRAWWIREMPEHVQRRVEATLRALKAWRPD